MAGQVVFFRYTALKQQGFLAAAIYTYNRDRQNNFGFHN